MITTILIFILLPIAVVLIILLFLIINILKQTKNYKLKLKIAFNNINSNRQNALSSIMKRISIIANSNSDFSYLKNKIQKVYNNFVKNMEVAKKKIVHLQIIMQKPRIFFIGIKKEYKRIEKFYPILNQLEDKFHILSNRIITIDTTIRNEFTFYKSCMLKAINAFYEKIILFDEIKSEIKKFIKNIKKIEQQCEVAINKGFEQKAIEIINNYIEKIVEFINIINQAPAISIQLKSQIRNSVEKLTKLYLDNKSKNKFNIPLQHIEFKHSINKIHNKFKRANFFLKKLDIKETKKEIISILESLKIIENKINLEIRSHKVFEKFFNSLVYQIEWMMGKWKKIKEQFKTVTLSGKILENDILDEYNNIQKKIIAFQSQIIDFKILYSKKNYPYSLKLQRAKFLSIELEKTLINLNNFIDKLWNINHEEAEIKQKFKRLEMAINDLIANTKHEKIILSKKENQEFEDILSKKTQLSQMINSIINKQTKELINNITLKVINFYSLINGKIQMAIHIKNILKEFANQRSLNVKLNLGLQLVEKNFLEGQYTIGLNQAIETIKEYIN